MAPLSHSSNHRGLLLAALAALLAPVVLLGCQAAVRPTAPAEPTMDLVGTVTALAAPAAATQTAISGAATQMIQLQATGTALVQAQTAVAGQTAAVVSAGASQTADAQGAAATQAAAITAATGQSATGTALAQVAAAQAATATALAQVAAAQAGTATALAKAQATSLTVPTPVTPHATLVPCVAVDPALAAIAAKAANAGLNPGCPTKAATSTTNGALQIYWANVGNPDQASHTRSLLIWNGDSRTIYVIRGKDTEASQGAVTSYADTWHDGDPEIAPACAGFVTPAGYLAPLRGFGKVWCANNLVPWVGWPNTKETAASLLIQPTRNGMLLKVSAPDQNAGYVLAVDSGAALAVTTNVGP